MPGCVGVDAGDPVAVGVENFAQVALVDDGHSRREPSLRLDPHVRQLPRQQVRVRERHDCDGVVYRRAENVVVASRVRATEEFEQVSEDCGQPAGQRTNHLDALRYRLELVSDVEAGHDQWAAVGENHVRGLGVTPQVELRRGSAVAEGAAAHQRDAPDSAGEVGRRAQRKRDVRQRAGGHQPDALLRSAGVDDETDRIVAGGRAAGLGQIGAVHAALSVHVFGVSRWARQRSIGAGMDGAVQLQQVAHDDGIARGRIEGCIASDGGDAQKVGVAGGDEDGDGIVVARVAIDDD